MSLGLYEREKPIPPEEYVRVDYESLKKWVKSVYVKLGLLEDHAEIVADVLTMADLMGISSHGVQRVSRYVIGIKLGTVNPRPKVRIVKDFGATALIDGDNGLGHPIALYAMNVAISKAERYGVSLVLVKNSHHFGIAGYYSLKAAEKGFIGLAITNSEPLVAYTHTAERYLGTNPIAVAIPRRNPPPILFDAATSVVPVGRIELYSKIGKEVPPGWAIDLEGNILSGNAKEILKAIRERKAALLPLGGLGEELGGHKGSGLSMIIDVFSGVLSGAVWGWHVRHTISDRPANVGHAIAAVNIDAFMNKDEFFDRLEKFISEIKSLKKHPKAERIWIPGEKAWHTMQTRLKIGIPIHKAVLNELKKISNEASVPFTVKIIKEKAY